MTDRTGTMYVEPNDMPTFSPHAVMRRLAELEQWRDSVIAYLRRYDERSAPTPPPAPAFDEVHEPPHGIRTEAAGKALWDVLDQESLVSPGVSKIVVDRAIDLGLAAPADRAVCEEAAQRERDRIVQAIRDYTGAENWRVVANWIASGANAHKDAAAHWRGAEAGKEASNG